jgi:hypothetical protein
MPHLGIRKKVATEALHKLVNSYIGPTPFAVDHFDRFHVRIKLLPLPCPVSPNLFFPDDAAAFRCLRPTHVLTHERQGAVDVPIIEGRVCLSYKCLCIRHKSFGVHDVVIGCATWKWSLVATVIIEPVKRVVTAR